MKTGIVALNPRAAGGDSLKSLCWQIHCLQEHGLCPDLEIVSIVHRNFFPYPAEVYDLNREKLIGEVKESLKRGIGNSLQYQNVQVVEAPFSNDEDLVDFLSRWAYRRRDHLLIMGVDPRQSVYNWLLGGIPETAILSAQTPILVIKANSLQTFPATGVPQVLLAVDPAAPPSKKAYRRLCRLVKPLGASIHLVAVLRKKTFLSSLFLHQRALADTEKVLQQAAGVLSAMGLSCRSQILHEDKGVAVDLHDYGIQNQIWITAITSPQRDISHRLFWGSTTQDLLKEIECPLLVLRTA